MRRALLIALTSSLVGAAAGVGAAYAVWRPYGEGSLTRAVLRKCGVREAPRLDSERCSVVVDDALTMWFVDYYGGETPTWLQHDPLAKAGAPNRNRAGTTINGRSAADAP